MGIYIPRARRAQLLEYKYSSTDKSLVSVSFHFIAAFRHSISFGPGNSLYITGEDATAVEA